MMIFDRRFFDELTKIDFATECNGVRCVIIPLEDGPCPLASEHHAEGKISNSMIAATHDFVSLLSTRSGGRYRFESDFRVKLYQLSSHSLGQSGRKQLHIGFDAIPSYSMFHSEWGCSIGLGFDFRSHRGINVECVNDYEAFFEKVFCEPELFDLTFGSLGCAEPIEDFKDGVSAEKVVNYNVSILQNWLFFGRRLTLGALSAYGSLDDFVDECIRTFDVISESGF